MSMDTGEWHVLLVVLTILSYRGLIGNASLLQQRMGRVDSMCWDDGNFSCTFYAKCVDCIC